jgi:hypothetical protein
VCVCVCFCLSIDSLACTATRLRNGSPRNFGSIPGKDKIIFSEGFRCALVPSRPTVHWLMGFLSPEIKQPTREADK